MMTEQSDLLFFDTFSHESNDELNLDLVQFPKSVYVSEIRVIPLGARVQGDFPGGVRLGATNPSQFHIDFFVNDLSKPGASTFEELGSFDYCQNGRIHMECEIGPEHPRIPTDGLVLKGWYSTITLAVYGNLTQAIVEPPVGPIQPQNVQRQSIPREPGPPPQPVPGQEWTPEVANAIPTYTGNMAQPNPEMYAQTAYPQDTYEGPMYRQEYYENEPPKDPRSFHHEEEWDKDRRLSPERSPKDRRPRRSRSIERSRSRDLSRHRDRSIDRLRSRSRSRDYMHRLSRSRSRSQDRRLSSDRDWDRTSYRRHRDNSYDRSRAGSYDKRSGSYERRSPYDKRGSSYERKAYDKRGPSYEKRLSPYDRAASYERRAPSYEKRGSYEKRHSPYRHYGSRSTSRDDPRKRPRSPTDSLRRPLSPGPEGSPRNSIPEEGPIEYDQNGKPIPREYYGYRHKKPIRSPSQETHPVKTQNYIESQHSSLLTVKIIDNDSQKTIESPPREESMDAEPFEPILSDEDICDDIEPPYMDTDYDMNDYVGVEDIIKYYNPFKSEWLQYVNKNRPQILGVQDDINIKHVLSANFEDLSEKCLELTKLHEIVKKVEQKIFVNSFFDLENAAKEDWVNQCEQATLCLMIICNETDIILRIFNRNDASTEFKEIADFLLLFIKVGLNFDFALSQVQPTYKIRHMKCGIRLAETLVSHKHNGQIMSTLLNIGINIPILLLNIYTKDYMALSIRLMILKALDGCLSSKESIEYFMKETIYPKIGDLKDNDRKNGYQVLIAIMKSNPLARIKFSINALIKKLNTYEVLENLKSIVQNFNKLELENPEKQEFDLNESDTDFLIHAFEEIIYMFRSKSFDISQPKRFLPVSAQFDINKSCNNEVLLEFFTTHHLLEICLYLLTCPTTCNQLVITSPIHDLLNELVRSHEGLKYLYQNMATCELLFKTLLHPFEQQNVEEFLYPHDLSPYNELQILGLEMAYRLKVLYYIESLIDLQSGVPDENELTDRLQSLYCLSFGSIGKLAVADIVVMGDNADSLMNIFENDLKNPKNEVIKQKSPAKSYAIDIIVLAVKFSADVPFLKKYGTRILNVAKDYEKYEQSVATLLQDVIPYLKPVEKPILTGDDIGECVEILKGCLDNVSNLPGEMITCLRILTHFCISEYDARNTGATETVIEEFVDLKYKYNVLQLFSHDGVAHICSILENLCTNFDQPNMHSSTFASIKGLTIAQVLLLCLRLLDEMLARAVRCRGSRFRDLTAAPVLLKAYGVARAYPNGAIGSRLAMKSAEAGIRALLAYAQPAADDAADGDSIRRGPWTTLCSEVISYVMTAPQTFVPGLLAFSELLPLPLPLQTRHPPTERELADAANERRLWSAHLHGLSNDLTDMIQTICVSAYRPVVHMLRRVCVQIADLAPNTAAIVARAAVGAVVKELKDGKPATTSAARVLGFLACLVAHAPVKCAVLHAMSGTGPKALEMATSLCNILKSGNSATEHSAVQEFAAHALAGLCDAEVTLTPPSAPLETLLANSLPNKDVLSALLDATADCLSCPTKTCSVASSILRAFFVVTEHEFGFQQFRKLIARRKDSFERFFRWTIESGGGEERLECLSIYLELLRIVATEEGEGPAGRRTLLAPSELAEILGYTPPDKTHPALTLDTILKERHSDEDAIANAVFLSSTLQKYQQVEDESPSITELHLPPPDSLVVQFSARTLYAIGDASDERLTVNYWLDVPSVNPAEDEVNDAELISVDIGELVGEELGGAEALLTAVRRLLGSNVAPRLEPQRSPAHRDKRPFIWPARRIGPEPVPTGDTFRSRPPNTSRPPSLHVDDFQALEGSGSQPRGPTGYNKPPVIRGMRRGGITISDRGRFASSTPQHTHYRHMRGRGAWDGGHNFGHFPPANQYMMGGMGWGGARMQRGHRRAFLR